ncbi:flagellar biosynthesis protein FlhB [Gammaproteobacteria bacterium 42_54_T18]|nr:flagellar biosynthesis protein FlhB [Gammaproteobacteria bacterium 42_54_T18]
MSDPVDTGASESQVSHQAVALTYDGCHAPFVSATGNSDIAEEILRIAKEHEIPIYENPELVDVLSRLELGDEIPELLYRTIAEIISFVYLLKDKIPNQLE